jgi:hypothetical protein
VNQTPVNGIPTLSLLKIVKHRKSLEIPQAIAVPLGGMVTILSALLALLSFRVRSRTSLALELIALRHHDNTDRAMVTSIVLNAGSTNDARQ